MPVIKVSDELHQFLYRVKARLGAKMTPSVFLDYLVFGMSDQAMEEVIQLIAEKAAEEDLIKSVATKVKDSML